MPINQLEHGVGRRQEACLGRGTMLEQFEVVEHLGSGGFGDVYRARDTRLGRVVAIKVLPEDFVSDAERR